MDKLEIPPNLLYSKIEEVIKKSEHESVDSWLEKYGNETYNKIVKDALENKCFTGSINLQNDSNLKNSKFTTEFIKKFNIKLFPVQSSIQISFGDYYYYWQYIILKPESNVEKEYNDYRKKYLNEILY
jgi:hypothetical protein